MVDASARASLLRAPDLLFIHNSEVPENPRWTAMQGGPIGVDG
jgi:hypothetical protein